jgi:hypothetical protein
MNDLIVIILTLLVAVAGVFGQIKKKKDETTTPASPENGENFWDILENEPEFQAENTFAEQEEIRESNPPIFTIPKTVEKNQPSIQHEKNTAVELPIKEAIKKEKISLRKAVIYSEILHNKYT